MLMCSASCPGKSSGQLNYDVSVKTPISQWWNHVLKNPNVFDIFNVESKKKSRKIFQQGFWSSQLCDLERQVNDKSSLFSDDWLRDTRE